MSGQRYLSYSFFTIRTAKHATIRPFSSTERGLSLAKLARHSLPRIESWHPVGKVRTSRSTASKKTLLVVDDDPSVLTFVHDVLHEGGHHVLSAPNGPEGLSLATNHAGEIHLLLSDFQMPGMSGIDLATAITRDRPNIKVLMMSGFADGMLVLNEGWHFLAKPFIPSQLRALVTGLLFPDKSRFRE